MTRLVVLAFAAYLAGRRQGIEEGERRGLDRAAGIFVAGLRRGKAAL